MQPPSDRPLPDVRVGDSVRVHSDAEDRDVWCRVYEIRHKICFLTPIDPLDSQVAECGLGMVLEVRQGSVVADDRYPDPHPGIALVHRVLESLVGPGGEKGALLSKVDEDVRDALDVMAGFCGPDASVPALLADHARLERLARAAVEAADKERDDAMLRIGDGRANKEATFRAVNALRAALPPAPGTVRSDRSVVVELPAEWLPRLATLTGGRMGPPDVSGVLAELADHAQQGVYRPGSWERPWLRQAFGDEFEGRLTADPDPDQAAIGWVVPRVDP